MIDTSVANNVNSLSNQLSNQTHRMIADQRLANAASSGSTLAAAAVAAAHAAHVAHAAHTASNAAAANAAANAAAVTAAGAAAVDGGHTTMSATQKNPFAIQELLGLTAHGDQIKNSSNSGTGNGNNSSQNNPSSNPVSGMGAGFPPISCYNSSFFNSSAVDQYSQAHQRMYFNSAGLFGNLHHQSQSFASSSAAASHLLDSTLRSEHSLSSKPKAFLIHNKLGRFLTTSLFMRSKEWQFASPKSVIC